MNDLEKQARADRAAHLLNDELIQDAIAGVKQAIHEQFAACPIRDKDGMQKLRIELHLMESFEANLMAMVNDGRMVKDWERRRKISDAWAA